MLVGACATACGTASDGAAAHESGDEGQPAASSVVAPDSPSKAAIARRLAEETAFQRARKARRPAPELTGNQSITYLGGLHPFGGGSQADLCVQPPPSGSYGPITLQGCVADNEQAWEFGYAGVDGLPTEVTVNGGVGCLDVQDADYAAGVVGVAACNGTYAQSWLYADGHLYPDYGDGTNAGSGRCLDVHYGGTLPGTVIDLAPCNGTSSQVFLPDRITVQMFHNEESNNDYIPVGVSGGDYSNTPTGTLIDLDVYNPSAAPNNQVAGDYFQIFFRGSAGSWAQIQAYYGLCVGYGSGYQLFLNSCSAAGTDWSYSDTYQFLGGNGECMDDNHDLVSSGNPVGIYPCNNANDQQWYLFLPSQMGPPNP